jgi:hypothetical protein
VDIYYVPPLGVIGEWFTKLFGGQTDDMLDHNLILFKKAVETGHAGPPENVTRIEDKASTQST